MRRLGILTVFAAVLATGVPAVQATTSVTGSIDWHEVRQPIDGFGASDAFRQSTELQKFPEPLRSQLLDALFSPTTGAGLTIVRHEVPNIGPPGAYTTDNDPGQLWFSGEARKRGATYVMGSVWSPPSWMKDNFRYDSGGHVRPDAYAAYADFLVEYVKQYKAQKGVVIDGVSIANEPNAATNYPSSQWTADEMKIFLRDFLRPRMALGGVDFDVIVPELSGWSDYLIRPTLADPVAASVVDVVAAHGYHYVETPSPLPAARDAGKRVWQTEMSEFCECVEDTIGNGLKWARWIHEFMTRAEASAWLYWWAVSVVGNGTSQQTLINLNTANQTAIVNKRLWTLGNFSRFVRPGWVRVGARVDGFHPDVLVSAYRDPATGQFAVVAVNDSAAPKDVSLAMNGFTAESVTPWRTSATENLAPLEPVAVDEALATTLAPQSVTTFVGRGRSTTDWRVSAPERVVVSPGRSVDVDVAVSGPPASSSVLKALAPLGLTASPAKQDVLGGAPTTKRMRVTASSAAAPGPYPLDLRAGHVADRTKVSVVGDAIEFSPGTAEEAEWLAEPGSSRLGGPVYDGRARFADGHGAYAEFPIYFVYGFHLPADVTGGTIAVDMANQFKVSASTDGRSFTEVLREPQPIRDGSNRRWYTFDIAALGGGRGTPLYLRFEDASVGDGWGAWVARVRADLVR